VLGGLPYAQLLGVLERRVMAFSEVLQEQNRRLGRDLLEPLDPAEGTVRFRKVSMALLEPFDVANGQMQALLGISDPNREALLEEFGGECDKIARTRALLAVAQQGLGVEGVCSSREYQSTAKERLGRCAKSCDSVEGVLSDCGLRERLRQAKEKWEPLVQEIFQRDPEARAGAAAPDAPATADAPAAQQAPERPLATAQELLRQIDEPGPEQEKVGLMDRLFEVYGAGGETLEGKDDPDSSYSRAIRDMVSYVQKEWDEREERLKRRMGKEQVLGPLSEERARRWVLAAVDLDGDGCITKDEAYVGFKRVVDVDPPSEYRRKHTP